MKPMAIFAALAVALSPHVAAATRLSDAEVKQRIINESLASYPGHCPCPYNSDRAGRSCGGRSAWSRPGGYAPKCYPADVTRAEVEDYRQSHR